MEPNQYPNTFPWQKPPSRYQRFKRNPALSIARYLYARKLPVLLAAAEPQKSSLREVVKVVCISDTHNTTPDIPDGDVLLHAGDLTEKGSFEELQAQLNWLASLPHKHKVVIAGNHDLLLDPEYVDDHPERTLEREGAARSDLDWGDLKYFDNSSVQISVNGRTVTIYGNPQMPYCGNWAFQHPPIRDVWKDAVPAETDILLTHTPPLGHLDLDGKGDRWLLRQIWQKKPRLMVFGHIHSGYGREDVAWDLLRKSLMAYGLERRGFSACL